MGYSPNDTPLPATSSGIHGFQPQNPYDAYGYDDDNFGSGALYPGGPIGLKNKRAEADRECKLHSCTR
jgi:hypothetical protein